MYNEEPNRELATTALYSLPRAGSVTLLCQNSAVLVTPLSRYSAVLATLLSHDSAVLTSPLSHFTLSYNQKAIYTGLKNFLNIIITKLI